MDLREFLIFFALILTTYDALQNSPPKVSEIPPALPFFDKDSLVTDWYKGELSKAFSSISLFDVSFVMYYAPWDAECQHVKDEFDKTAQIMFKQVHFSAINCWNPGGECRLLHNHISVWPIIIAHTNLLKTLIYNGPMDYMSMVKFLQQVIKPLNRLTSSDSLIELVSVCDAVVVGFTPMDNDSSAYNVFYNVALKNLELDPFGNICFGLVTSEKLAVEMGVESLPHSKLVLWNQTLEFPSTLLFNEENISNWIIGETYRHAFWVIPSWQKSFKMQNIFSQGSVLILFTPRNLFYDQTPYYDLFREVALEYNNCGDKLVRVVTKLKMLQRHKYMEFESKKAKICENIESVAEKTINKKAHTKLHQYENVKNVWMNKTSCKTDIFVKRLQMISLSEESYFPAGMQTTQDDLLGLNGFCPKNDRSACSGDYKKSRFFNEYDQFENYMKKINNLEVTESSPTSMLDMVNDPRSSPNLQKRYMKELCVKVGLAKQINPQHFPVIDGGSYKIEGLKCQTNRTIFFIAIDSLVNHFFAESLGINILKKTDKTAAVIIDNKAETQYILEKPYGEKSLREFIFNYTTNILNRNLRTTIGSSDYTHYYQSDIKNGELQIRNGTNKTDLCKPKSVCVKELNTLSFGSFILQKNKALLVALCGGGTGSCGGLLSLTLLTVANFFFELRDSVQVARIDTAVNDLPWEYTVSKYPTLIFFPAGKKENSRSYPENQPITVEGVLAFVLSGLETPIKLHAKVLLCNQTVDDYDMKKCLSSIRTSVVDLIGNMLKHWRRTQDLSIKNILLRRLQCLRAVAINLGALNTTKVPLSHPVYKMFSETICSLSRVWRATSYALKRRQASVWDYDTL